MLHTTRSKLGEDGYSQKKLSREQYASKISKYGVFSSVFGQLDPLG